MGIDSSLSYNSQPKVQAIYSESFSYSPFELSYDLLLRA